ncbi:phage tail protein [Endozoicomonas sp. SESOKO4]|uniref:phage tail-collar fiber domain-containing protein n=1 Tax=Endozoicomonas sp. SESOKO4 TaxID=2828745 RepID=UPI002147809E|nr:phage tail protein [Endozoicomonas sp. SESOKO4]
MTAAITYAGETLIAQKQANGEVLTIGKFILANIPNLNPSDPIDRTEGMPAQEHIVLDAEVSQAGYINPNLVVHSLMLGTGGDEFDFNWMGLYAEDDDVIVAITYLPLQTKFISTAMTRNFMLEYSGARETGDINIPAESWMMDVSARLEGNDERGRQSTQDVFGRQLFYGDACKVVKNADGYYDLLPGQGYVAGIRFDYPGKKVLVSETPTSIWLNVSQQGNALSDVEAVVEVVVSDVDQADYLEQGTGVWHYLEKIAEIDDPTVTDLRLTNSAPINSYTHSSLVDAANDKNLGRNYLSIADRAGANFNKTTQQDYSTYPDSVKFIDRSGHYWVLKLQSTIDLRWFGLNGVDDTQALQDAVDLANAKGDRYLIDNGGNTLAITRTVNWKPKVNFTGGTIQAVGNWWADNDADGELEVKGKPILSFADEKYYSGIENTVIDCGLTSIDPTAQNVAAAGIYSGADARNLQMKNLHILHFNGYGILTVVKNTDSFWSDIQCQQWIWGEKGHTDITQRTATGITCHTSDGVWVNCISMYSKYPFHLNNFYNAQFTNCHAYNGSYPDAVNLPVMYIGENCHGTIWTNFYLDNGYVELRSFDHIFKAMRMTKTSSSNTTYPFKLIATEENETAIGLVVDGAVSAFSNKLFEYKAEGSRSWSPVKDHVVKSIISPYEGFVAEYPQRYKKVTPLGHEMVSNILSNPVSIANRQAQYQSMMQHYSSGYHAAEFTNAGSSYPAFRGAKSRSEDFSLQPLEGDTLCEFWGTGSTGVDFGTPEKPFIGGGGIRVSTTEDWTATNMSTGLWFYITEPDTTNPIAAYKMESLAFYPVKDNVHSAGRSGHRFSQVYAGTGSINTSDFNEKDDIRELSSSESNVARKLKSLIRVFRFKDAIKEKGDDARMHVGVIAQEVKAAFEAEGLDPFKYGILCFDEWEEKIITHPEEISPVYDEEGNVIEEIVVKEEYTEVIPAGERYGIRYDELLSFVVSTL